jgi:glutamate dehydrogenase
MSANMTEALDGLERAKADLLAQPREATRTRAPWVRRYYRHVASEDILERKPEELLAAVVAHRELAAYRPQGSVIVRVTTADEGDNGLLAHSVVEVVCDDMPFLVDIGHRRAQPQRARHPPRDPSAARGPAGRDRPTARGVSDGDRRRGRSRRNRRVLMRIEVDRVADEDGGRALAADLERVLRDVREAVEDWPKMQRRALQIAEEIEAEPPRGIPGQEGRRDDRAAALAGRPALHLPRLPASTCS